MSNQIKIVYFAYLVPDVWESIVSEQLDSLYNLKSLYESAEIYMSVNDTSESHTELEKLRIMILNKYSKVKLINISSTNQYEYPGIKSVYELSSDNDDEYILYFHSKGMLSNESVTRQMQFKYTIENYENILEEMNKNKEIDTASLIPSVHGFGYYNFFWARSSYINKYCSKPENSESYKKHGRFTWEMWLGNHYSNKNFIKTYSPVFKYNQVYDERGAVFLMNLFNQNNMYEIQCLSDPLVFSNKLKNVEKTMDHIADNSLTDKNTAHCYFGTYESLFTQIRKTVKNVLEVGIYHRGSIQLWRDYFVNANIYAVDICDMNFIKKHSIKSDKNITLFTNTNGYDDNFIKNNFHDKNIKFDVIIDDGPHTLQTNVEFIIKYSSLLSETGIMVIEDVQDFNWIETFKQYVPNDLKQYIQVYDLREVKNRRYDDILFVINKNI